VNISLLTKTLRVHQWIKNLLVLAPAVFAVRFSQPGLIGTMILGFFAFSFMASVVYVINDLVDRKEDALHARKKSRPIASGAVSVRQAVALAVGFGVVGGLIALYLSTAFAALLGGYLLLNVIYSRYLKRQPIIDLLAVTSFYIVRVYAGGVLAQVHVSEWLILTTFFLALFLITVKRRQELLSSKQTRKVLQEYNKEFLDLLIIVSVTSTILFYTLYTTTRPEVFTWSVLFVVYGVLRYVYMVFVNNHGEEPERLIVSDAGIWFALIGWTTFVGLFFAFS
jgi:4-hydroxybenzoate polyprenyltransferase